MRRSHLSIGQHLVESFAKTIDHRLGCAGRREYAVVGQVFEAGEAELSKGGYIRQGGLARTAQHGDHANPPALVVLNEIGH